MTNATLLDRKVRIGVVGVGVMGQNHLRVYERLKDAILVGCFDVDSEKNAEAAAQFGCRPFSSTEDMIGAVDAVSICAPSSLHRECGLFFLNQGVHCLIEKPLATTKEDCLALIDSAQRNDVQLLVGHIERFNPAVQQIFTLLSEGAKIQAIDAQRLSAVSARIRDIDVVTDLMVHDLDIVLALEGSPVKILSAAEVSTEKSHGGDHVTTLIQFESGVLANLTASRISQLPIRRLTVTTDSGVVAVDYMNQSADIYLHSETITRDRSISPFGEYSSGISLESVQIRRQEPLQLELIHFVNIIQTGAPPKISGAQALAALDLVWDIQAILGNSTRDAD
jgi:predicted dehydrogenase